MRTLDKPTPTQLGYRMPAEWEPHEATWIAWPHNRDDWPGKFAPVPWVYTEIVRHLSRVETVFIVVRNGVMKRRVADLLDRASVDLERVQFFRAATDRVWLRDSGPTFLVRGRGEPQDEKDLPGPVHLVDWRFNAWSKYSNHKEDNRIPQRIASHLGYTLWIPRVARGQAPPRRHGRRRDRRQRPG